MAMTWEEQARRAQLAMRTAGNTHRHTLRSEVFLARNEPGVQKVLEMAKEMRAKALFDLANGTKEKFDANQAVWSTWDFLVTTIEEGPPPAINQQERN